MFRSADLKKLILLLLTAFMAIGANAQANFSPGYIIDLQGDTIQGLIDDAGEVENMKMCHFKASEDSETLDYLPGAIASYRFAGSKFYETKSVTIDGRDYLVFAECLVKGKASLYYVRSEDFERYFMEKENSAIVPLTNEKKELVIDGNKTTVQSKSYIRMLKATFSDCYEIQASIDNVTLSHRSLKNITCKYNDCADAGAPCITYDKGSRIKFRVGPVIGYSLNNIMLKGSEPFESFIFDNSNDPVVGLVVDLSSSRLGNLSFQFGTDFGLSDFTTTYEEPDPVYPLTTNQYTVYMEGTSMKMYTGAKYNFGRKRFKPNLGGGLMLHKYIQPDFRYEVETYLRDVLISTDEWHGDLVDNWLFGAYLQAGVDMDLGRKLVLFANVKGGFGTSNPKTMNILNEGNDYDQIRVRYDMIPVTFSLGILF